MTEVGEGPETNDAREPAPRPDTSPESSSAGASGLARAGDFAWRHRAPLARGFGVLLILIIVLQNVEATRVDLLFWSLPAVPKLVLIGVSMLAGGLAWELVRRALWSNRS